MAECLSEDKAMASLGFPFTQMGLLEGNPGEVVTDGSGLWIQSSQPLVKLAFTSLLVRTCESQPITYVGCS